MAYHERSSASSLDPETREKLAQWAETTDYPGEARLIRGGLRKVVKSEPTEMVPAEPVSESPNSKRRFLGSRMIFGFRRAA